MSSLNLAIAILASIATITTALRFVGKWGSRIVDELVKQTSFARMMAKNHTAIMSALARIERRQILMNARFNRKVEPK